MPLAHGTRLGPYEIESLIGSGGMGEVYKAHDGRLNRTVAIKQMIAEDHGRFQSEARAIAAINHPHICQIYDVGPDYLVLEYLAGEPLRGPVTPDEAVRLASQIADALQAAHDRGILHRDLKPANVIVVRQGGTSHAKLLDFGIARLREMEVRPTSPPILRILRSANPIVAHPSTRSTTGSSSARASRSSVIEIASSSRERDGRNRSALPLSSPDPQVWGCSGDPSRIRRRYRFRYRPRARHRPSPAAPTS